jgi:hypothetical protein
MPFLRSEYYNAFKRLPSATMGCGRLAIIDRAAENPGLGLQGRGGTLVRSAILALLVAVAACSSSTTPVPPSDPQASAALLKKDCADPQWKEDNLGLWYSVCRQPLRW